MSKNYHNFRNQYNNSTHLKNTRKPHKTIITFSNYIYNFWFEKKGTNKRKKKFENQEQKQNIFYTDNKPINIIA